ncbi:Glyoxylate reductase/hydroxypyruvate reductase [Holothuria leucospilota]|uniref:Glyoxylate reductase/hydroxypyruvate reductase n=1 Tax=Holothuria leucospilota TaxID=206669 RepID=A0A9Q1CBL2_HOLLE|nr:Glyoxylate reductase/hydroxypyruvate reductase [Holothuria leucospilota]
MEYKKKDQKHNVLVCLFELSNRHMDMLRAAFNVITWEQFDKDRVKVGKTIDAAIYNPASEEPLSSGFLLFLPNLKTFCFISRGVNPKEAQLLRERGIEWTSLPDVQSESCADLVFGLILAASRRIIEVISLTASVRAKDPEIFKSCHLFLGKEVSGSTLGIIGMGSIGYKVAERAKGFHMNVLYHNRHKRSDIDEAAVGAKYFYNLRDMLPLVDTLVIACPLTPETKGAIGTEEFKMMKSSAIIVNIARGSIINTDALVNALQSGYIRAAALDATDPEPLPGDHPLLDMPNVLITPHIGSATWETRDEMVRISIENVFVGIKHGSPSSVS